MNENIETATGDDESDDGNRAAVLAADDTGLVTNEIQIVEVELHEGEVTPIE
jgi:hypothetical protein